MRASEWLVPSHGRSTIVARSRSKACIGPLALLLLQWVLLASILTLGCRAPEPKRTADAERIVAVAAAADLRYALPAVIDTFRERHPGIKVEVTYASSGVLFAQLQQQAPFDLYLAADVDYARRLVADGQAADDLVFEYARGYLDVWTLRSSTLDLERLGLRAVVDPSVRKVAIANPQHAPYGRAAVAALESLGLYDEVRQRLVFGENISQVAQFVETGAADVGIIARSLAVSPALRDRGVAVAVPADAHPPLIQGGVILRWARDRQAAEMLRDALLGTEGRRILATFGFDPPAP